MLSKSDKDLYVTKRPFVNYVGTRKETIEAMINVVVVFSYDIKSRVMTVFIRNLDKKDSRRVFKEVKQLCICTGDEMRKFAIEWYSLNYEEIKLFA